MARRKASKVGTLVTVLFFGLSLLFAAFVTIKEQERLQEQQALEDDLERDMHILQPEQRNTQAFTECPKKFVTKKSGALIRQQFTARLNDLGSDAELHLYGFLNNQSILAVNDPENFVLNHLRFIPIADFELLFEAGMAAGSALNILKKRYPKIAVSGIDMNPDLVQLANNRIKTKWDFEKFCAADARDIEFIRANSVDHAISMDLMRHMESPVEICQVAAELLRIVRPGGFVFLGLLSDEAIADVNSNFWFRFAKEFKARDVMVLREKEVLGQIHSPSQEHLYNVYIQKAKKSRVANGNDICHSFRSSKRVPRLVALEEEKGETKNCKFPFLYENQWYDDCVLSAEGHEWCPLKSDYVKSAETRNVEWGLCTPREKISKQDAVV